MEMGDRSLAQFGGDRGMAQMWVLSVDRHARLGLKPQAHRKNQLKQVNDNSPTDQIDNPFQRVCALSLGF
jgi:hypothetical protein